MFPKAEWQEAAPANNGAASASHIIGAAATGLAIIVALALNDARPLSIPAGLAAVLLLIDSARHDGVIDVFATSCAGLVLGVLAVVLTGVL